MLYQQQGVHGHQPNCFWGVVRGLGCWGHCPSFWPAWGTLAPGYPYLKVGLLVLGTIELHKYDNVMFCGAQSLFCVADEWSIQEAETLASKAVSNSTLLLMLVLNTTELQQQTTDSVPIGGTYMQSSLSRSEFDGLQLIASPDQEPAARVGGDNLLWHQVHVWT